MAKTKNKFSFYSGIVFIILAISLGIAFYSGKNQVISYSLLNNLNYSNGSKFDPKILENKKKIIYFWATWCSTCNTNLPFIVTNFKYLTKYTDIGFISVEEGDSKPELDKYIREKKLPFPVLSGNIEILKNWNIGFYPTTLFLNEKNEIKFVDTGILNPISFWLRILFL